jgi:DNA-dependent RNA polymerase auxiliary subunit epsilon
VLDSVVRELDEFLNTLHFGIIEAREKVCSCNYLVEIFITLQDKLLDYEECLKQSEEEFNEIKLHSASFQWTLCSFSKTGNGKQFLNFRFREGVRKVCSFMSICEAPTRHNTYMYIIHDTDTR